MSRCVMSASAALCLLLLAAPDGMAATIFNNATPGGTGNCAWDTACAAAFFSGDTIIAAQQFSLGGAGNIASATVVADVSNSATVSYINWYVYAAQSGLPSGGPLYAGSATDSTAADGIYTALTFNVGAALTAGTYFFAMQAVAGTGTLVYLENGPATAGAAETINGGTSWSANYQGATSLALDLFGSAAPVPEPLTLSLLGAGIAGLLAARRRR